MKIKINRVVLEETGRNIGIEISIDDDDFFKLTNDKDLPGVRVGKIIPGWKQKFAYEPMCEFEE